MAKARLKVPATASKGEIITVKSLISHPMETGQRKDKAGNKIPRKIINNVVCTYNGRKVLESNWHPAISADPYLAFNLRASESGTIEVTWTDDDGSKTTESAKITVS